MALTPGKQGASARLRKAFKYPSDDSDSEPEAMDEEGTKPRITYVFVEF